MRIIKICKYNVKIWNRKYNGSLLRIKTGIWLVPASSENQTQAPCITAAKAKANAAGEMLSKHCI